MSQLSPIDELSLQLSQLICNQITYARRFSLREYEGAYNQYRQQAQPAFQLLGEQLSQCGPEQISPIAEALLNALQQQWCSGKRQRPSDYVDMVDKMTLVSYFLPALQQEEIPFGKEFIEEFSAQWQKRYPSSPFQAVSYEEIDSGFRRKLCFITTAVCRYQKKADNCYELQQFRSFRDGYLRRCSDGPALIEEYYNIAPAIVAHIDYCCDPAQCYPAIWQNYLHPCLQLIEAGQPEHCKQRYTEMVRALEKEHLFS